MKKVKSILVLLILMNLICLLFSSNVKASSEDTLLLGVKLERQTRNSFKTEPISGEEVKIWKIVSYPYTNADSPNNNSSSINISGREPNYSKLIYCLKAEQGFASTSTEGSDGLFYYYRYNMLDSNNNNNVQNILNMNSNTYQKLLWVLTNMYVPLDDAQVNKQQRDALLTKAFRYAYVGHDNIEEQDIPTLVENSKLNDEYIEVVQQLAIWYFTNNENPKYNKATLPTILMRNPSLTSGQFKSLADIFNDRVNDTEDGTYLQQDASALFSYLINNATQPVSQQPIQNPVTKTDTVVTMQKHENRIIVGPYSFNKNSDDYQIQGSVTDQNGRVLDYTLLNSDKTDLNTKDLKQVIGNGNFYISVPYETNIETVKLEAEVNYITDTSYKLYTTSDATYRTQQPVVIIEKGNKSYTITTPVSERLDLALRKFITKINNREIENSREPQIDISKLNTIQNGILNTTAIYQHPKAPLAVKTGDTVLYTIRIYNEGNISGYAKQITDYLPEGLEYIEDSQINRENGWSNPTGDKKQIITEKLATTLLTQFQNNNLSYADVQVECKVVAKTTTQDSILRNVAEITKHSDEYGNENVIDRDSTPNNVNLNGYTTNQQDDDDFEDLIILGEKLDLALRKFITKINNREIENSREPQVDISKLNTLQNGQFITTATYNHPKTALPVETGDTVLYTIRIYNEGNISGYAKQITDYLPEGLEYIEDSQINKENGWSNPTGDKKQIVTEKLANILLKRFENNKLDYADIQVECKVVATTKTSDKVLRNVAEITKHSDEIGNENALDRDSTPNNVNLNGYTTNQQDDDDFEDLVLLGKQFDLAIRKFVTKINGHKIQDSREPQVDISELNKIENTSKTTTAIYNHSKKPVSVKPGDLVTFTIRVYNEGALAGYANEIIDHLPKGLEFVNNEENANYLWEYDENDTSLRTVKTRYLSYMPDSKKNLILPFDGTELKYRDIEIICKVVEDIEGIDSILTNIAEVTDFADADGNIILDRDSQETNVILPSDEELPNYKNSEIASGKAYIPGQQDDDDFEKLIIEETKYFDLALRKFITGVDKLPVNNRYPVPSINENGKITYNHTKEPLEVENGNIITYTIRVYNEGNQAGYASEITDTIPQGLEFLPDNEINKEYKWKMIDKEGKETTNIQEAENIITTYLAKENETTEGEFLLEAFDEKAGIQENNPHYLDVKVAFKIVEPETSDRIIINEAQISQDTDEKGNPVDDIDSIPKRDEKYDYDDENKNEDDIDYEKVKVKYFDLALKKWVTQAIVTVDGKTTVTETGHTGEENPEPVVKVEIKESQLNKIEVKFKYKIKVTNEGEIAGYVKEIKDRIPEGLKFVAQDNPQWQEIDKNIVVTDQAKDILLQPGESTTVEILLTWINGSNNMGKKVNIAEISKDYNDSNTPDIDSTPDNNVPGEDDIDDAPVILSVKTGKEIFYTNLSMVILITIAGGTILIKKFVL